ncbi:MAG: hypothetical protein U5R46_08950 [Gammaproteobacteria bacterium]|nr:hypothetical protein [Gammaproteobacteria bacterium]
MQPKSHKQDHNLIHSQFERRGWSTSIFLRGIMVGAVVGLPMGNVIGAHFGWRESLWATTALATLAAGISLATIPAVTKEAATGLRGEVSSFSNGQLWQAFRIQSDDSQAP